MTDTLVTDDAHSTIKRIDANVYCTLPSITALFPYLPAYWIEQVQQTGFRGATADAYPPSLPISARPGTQPSSGQPAGSDLSLLQTQVLDAWNLDAAILSCSYAIDTIRNPDAAAAVAAAINDWLHAEWLDQEPRLRGTMVVPNQLPELAVSEIERVGDNPRFVQVCLPARTASPYGRRDYHKVFAAAVDRNLAVGLQFGGFPGNPPTAVGWPSYIVEEYVGMASVVQSQVISLIAEGVFERFPRLRVAIVEGGFTWLPSLMWRFDKDWKGLRREVPWVRRPPSEYIRDHTRFTTQPLDAPLGRPETLEAFLEQMWGVDLLMHSTGYPHWHFDKHGDALPPNLSVDRLASVMGGNAKEFYGLE